MDLRHTFITCLPIDLENTGCGRQKEEAVEGVDAKNCIGGAEFRSSAWRPGHLAASEEVDVKVWNTFSGMKAVIDNDTEAV